MQQVLLALIRVLALALSGLDASRAVRLMYYLILMGSFFSPKLRRVALQNLRMAYPDSSPQWRDRVFHGSLRSLARLLVDFARLPSIDRKWVEAHVDTSALNKYRNLKRAFPGKGILLATGHLGSFELLAHVMPLMGHPIAFVVRNFGMERIDRWWRAQRERNGNRVISRKGAFQELRKSLKDGVDTAVLFDQNVTRNHAVFVDWFGKKAATTRAVALAALCTEAPVIVAGMINLPGDHYRIEITECDFRALYESFELTAEEKVLRITQTISSEYEKLIRLQPESWFWIHRRWKTRPEGEAENLYAGC